MGAVSSTPINSSSRPRERADYLIGTLVGEKSFPLALNFGRNFSNFLSIIIGQLTLFVKLARLSDADGSVPFCWGADSEGHVVVSDDIEIVKKGCQKSFAPFPKGCFFTSTGGLRSHEHPRNELKPVPRVDSSGEVCGSTFKVDSESKKETGMPRARSAADWSSHY